MPKNKIYFFLTILLFAILTANFAKAEAEQIDYDSLSLFAVEGNWETFGTGSQPYHVIGAPDGQILRIAYPEGEVAKIVYIAKAPFKTFEVNLAEIHDGATSNLISTGADPSDEAIYVSKDGENWVKVTWSTSDRVLVLDDVNCGDVTNDGIDDTADIYRITKTLDEAYIYLKIQDEAGGENSIEVDSAGIVPLSVGNPNSEYVLEVNGIPLDGEDAKLYIQPGDTVTFKVYKRNSGFFGIGKDYVGDVDIYINGELAGRIPTESTFLFFDNPFSSPSFTYTFPNNGVYTAYGIKNGIETTGGIIYVGYQEGKRSVLFTVVDREEKEEGVYEIEFNETLKLRVYYAKGGGWMGLLGLVGIYDYVPAEGAKIYQTSSAGDTLIGTTDENGYFSYKFEKGQGSLYGVWYLQAEYNGEWSYVLEIRAFDQLEDDSIPIQEVNVTGDSASLEVFVGTDPKAGTVYMPISNASVYIYEYNEEDYQLIGHIKTASNGTVITQVPANKQLKVVAEADGYEKSEPTFITLIPDERKSIQIILKAKGLTTPYTEYYLNAKPTNKEYYELVIPVGEKITFWISKDANSWVAEAGGTLHVDNKYGKEVITEEIDSPGFFGGGHLDVQFDTPGTYTAYAEVEGELTKNKLTITVLEQSDFENYKNDYFIVADKRTARVGETIEVWVTKDELSLDKGKSVNATIEIFKAYANGTLERWAKANTKETGFIWKEHTAKFHLIEPGTFVIQGSVEGIKTRNTWRLTVEEGSVTDPSSLRLGWKLVKQDDDNRHNAFIGGGAVIGTILGALAGGVGAPIGGLLGTLAGYGVGYLANVVDDWFVNWQYEDAVIPVGSEMEFAIIQNDKKLTGELYINGERVGVFENGSVKWTFANPGEYEVKAYYAVNDINATAQNTTLLEVTNSPLYFTVGTSGQGLLSNLPSLTGLAVIDLLIYIIFALILLAVVLSIIRAIL